jgi:hypothetical protein
VVQVFAARERHGLHDPARWVHCDEICIRLSSNTAVIWDWTGETGDYRSTGMEKETLTGMLAATCTGYKFPPFCVAKAAKTDLTYTLGHKPSDPNMPFMVIWRKKGYMSASAYKVFLKWLRAEASSYHAGNTNIYNATVENNPEEPLGPTDDGSDFTFRSDPPPDTSDSESDEEIEPEEDLVNLDADQLREMIAALMKGVSQPEVLLGLAHDYAYSHHTPELEVLARTLFFITVVISKGLTGKLQVMDLAVFKPLRALYNEIQIEDLRSLHEQGLQPTGIREWRGLAIKWLCEAWRRIPSAFIVRAGKKSSLSLHEDGSEDHLFNVQVEHMKIDVTPFRELGLRLGRQQREQDQDGCPERPMGETGETERAVQQEKIEKVEQPARPKKRQRTSSPSAPDTGSDMYIADEDIRAGMFVPVRVEEQDYNVPFLIMKVDSVSGASVIGCYYSLAKRGGSNVANKWTPDFEQVESTQGLVPLRRTVKHTDLIPARIVWKGGFIASGSKEGGYLANSTLESLSKFLSKK